MTDRERMLAGEWYSPYHVEGQSWSEIQAALKRFNESEFWKGREEQKPLMKLFKHCEEDLKLTPPFFCDRGDKISFGKHFYANTGLVILDDNEVTFGDHCFLGPRVSIYAGGHPILAEARRLDLEEAKPVHIGNDVWIGGDTVINPGVTIGDDVVIGSGSVVTGDIPAHTVAAGNPCRVIRVITEEEREILKKKLEDYLKDEDTFPVAE